MEVVLRVFEGKLCQNSTSIITFGRGFWGASGILREGIGFFGVIFVHFFVLNEEWNCLLLKDL